MAECDVGWMKGSEGSLLKSPWVTNETLVLPLCSAATSRISHSIAAAPNSAAPEPSPAHHKRQTTCFRPLRSFQDDNKD
jgi:hypothetical protein